LGPHVSSGSLINPYSEQETALFAKTKEQKTEKRKESLPESIAGSRQSWFLDVHHQRLWCRHLRSFRSPW